MNKAVKLILIIFAFALFLASAFILFEPGNDPTGFFVYAPGLAVVNHKNNQPLNSNLKIEFMTKGTNDLIITSLTGNMEFLELNCNNQKLAPAANNKDITYKGYKCDKHSFVLIKVLSEELKLQFKFGNEIEHTHNSAS